MRGEILVWDGRVLATPGESLSGSAQPPKANDQAALLVTAQVKEWEKVQVPSKKTLSDSSLIAPVRAGAFVGRQIIAALEIDRVDFLNRDELPHIDAAVRLGLRALPAPRLRPLRIDP
jgi:hypothetical protein